MLKKILLLILVVSIGFGFAFANAENNTKEFVEIQNPVGENNIWGIINRLINILFIACIYGGIIMIIWAGWTMVTSQGKPEKTKAATQIIVWVLIGIVVVGLAKAMISFTYYIVTGNKSGINWGEQQSIENNNKDVNEIYTPEINQENGNVNTIPNLNSNLLSS
jgi:heme/copper-type cytochrome/quinol oxidase subunit 2